MPSRTERASDTGDAQTRLQTGLQFEQCGMWAIAHATYEGVRAQHPGTPLGVEAQIRIARVFRGQAQWTEALAVAETAAAQASTLGEPDLWAEAVNVAVGVHLMRGEHGEADRVAVAALAHAANPRIRGLLLHNRGSAAAQQRDFDRATTLFADAVAEFQAAEYEIGMAFALNSRSAAAHDAGRPTEALELAQTAHQVALQARAYDQCILAVENQADPLVSLGRFDEAEALASQALGHFGAIDDQFRCVECLEILGRIFAARTDTPDRSVAGDCYRRGLEIARQIGAGTLMTRMERRLQEVA